MCARVCRTWDVDDDEKLDQTSVKLAEKVLKVGQEGRGFGSRGTDIFHSFRASGP